MLLLTSGETSSRSAPASRDDTIQKTAAQVLFCRHCVLLQSPTMPRCHKHLQAIFLPHSFQFSRYYSPLPSSASASDSLDHSIYDCRTPFPPSLLAVMARSKPGGSGSGLFWSSPNFQTDAFWWSFGGVGGGGSWWWVKEGGVQDL